MAEKKNGDEELEIIDKLRKMGVSPEIFLLFEGTKPLKIAIKDAVNRNDKRILEILSKIKTPEKIYFKMVRLLRSIKDYPWIVDRTLVERAIRLVIQYEYEFGNFVDDLLGEEFESINRRIETLEMVADRIKEIIKDFEDSISTF